jgi:cytochrome c peroxidase
VLWAPPILAMENPTEMNFTRLQIAHAIAAYYPDAYTAVFGALPPLADAARFPAIGKPGDAAWDAMAPDDQDAVDRVAANVGKALAAYVRKLATGPTALDRWLAGDRSALTDAQQRGMTVFVRAGCATCHGGPASSDGAFHDLGVGGDDPGRAAAIEVERAQLFSPDGPYADEPQPIDIADATPDDAHAFRTPTLRDVALTAPYLHDGSIASLRDAVAFQPEGASLEAGELDDLVEFLAALSGQYPDRPWNNWPDTP